jgi:dTDP-4-amino-4,6-dideoxygalactose transaminase
MDWQIPLSDIDFGPEESAAVESVLRSKWLTMGAVTQQLEQAFSEYVGVKHAIAVTNATAALHLACVVVGLGPGDEAIVPSLTFVATANAVRYTGATPVFADIADVNDLNISCESIERAITGKTRAIIVVHYGGYACDMPGIMELARKRGLKVIEDAAHAVGSELDGRRLGGWGDVGCFSFFSNKNMTTGEGGMVVTANPAHAERVKVMRSHGLTSSTYERFKGHAFAYDVTELGWNYRMDEMRAALGLAQLAKLPAANRMRREVIAHYRRMIGEYKVPVTIPFTNYSGTPGDHIFPVLLPQDARREEIMGNLASAGIQTSIHYRPVHTFTDFAGARTNLPITDAIAPRILSLPLYPHLAIDDIRHVVTTLGSCLR